MKVIIGCLNSKYIHSSLAPWYLAAGVKLYCRENMETKVMESTINADLAAFAEEIILEKPDVVSFSCYIWNITKTLSLCEILKKELDCTLILGGPEVSYRASDVLNRYPFIDYVLSGEGEESYPLLLSTVKSGGDLSAVFGLSFRKNGEIVSVPEKEAIGTPPSPYSEEYFNQLHGRICYIETSRGCPFRCAFCLSGRCSSLRFFDMEQVKTDILKLANSGTQTVKFVDRTFNANVQHANEILTFIRKNYGKAIPQGVCFHFEIAGDILKESTFNLLKSMPQGAVQLEIGMQSFNEETLRLINRKTNIEKLKENIIRLIGFGNMHIHIDLIAGLTGEDKASFEQSFNIGYSLKANMLQMGFLKLLHGADMREYPEKYPCTYREEPPYEVTSTPWLTEEEIKTLKNMEDAVERLYNSGRFLLTLEYLIDEAQFAPFSLFFELGNALCGEGMSLKEYAEKVYFYFGDRCDKEKLREKMACDLLLCGSSKQLPDCLKIIDPFYKKVKAKIPDKTKFVLLYSKKAVFCVDESVQKDFSGRFKGKTLPFSEFEED